MEAERSRPGESGGLRLWPGVVAAALIVIGLFVGLIFTISLPDLASFGLLGAIIGTLVVFVWWLFFSRAPWPERLGALVLMIAFWFAMRPLLDRTILGGAMGALPAIAFTVFAVALVAWAAATQGRSRGVRFASIFPAVNFRLGIFFAACVLRAASMETGDISTPSDCPQNSAMGKVKSPKPQ